jgi:uncharacterized protein with ATP-grasp and redox domains
MSDVARDVFFLLKAKCPVVARELGCEREAMVVRRTQDHVDAGELATCC